MYPINSRMDQRGGLRILLDLRDVSNITTLQEAAEGIRPSGQKEASTFACFYWLCLELLQVRAHTGLPAFALSTYGIILGLDRLLDEMARCLLPPAAYSEGYRRTIVRHWFELG